MRTKQVHVEDANYTIGKLSCGQVDEIIFAQFEIEQDKKTQIVAVVQGSKKAVRNRICPAIAASLNNATLGNAKWFLDGWDDPRTPAELDGKAQWWTPEDVFTDLGFTEMVQLYEEVSKLAELQTRVEQSRSKSAGEELAVDAPMSS